MKKYFALVIVIIAVLATTTAQASCHKKCSWKRGLAAAALGGIVAMRGFESVPPVTPTAPMQYGVNPYGSTSYPIHDTTTECVVPADFDVTAGAVFDLPKTNTACVQSHYDPEQLYCRNNNVWEPDYNDAAADCLFEEMNEAIKAHRAGAKAGYIRLQKDEQIVRMQTQYTRVVEPLLPQMQAVIIKIAEATAASASLRRRSDDGLVRKYEIFPSEDDAFGPDLKELKKAWIKDHALGIEEQIISAIKKYQMSHPDVSDEKLFKKIAAWLHKRATEAGVSIVEEA